MSIVTSTATIRERLLTSLSSFYNPDATTTNYYKWFVAIADILAVLNQEVSDTLKDVNIDEITSSRVSRLYPNFGYGLGLSYRGMFGWDWDDYRFFLKVLAEANTLYATTPYGIRRATQVATEVSPTMLEHYKYGGWILDKNIVGVATKLYTGVYNWNTISQRAIDDQNIIENKNIVDIDCFKADDVWMCTDTGQIYRKLSNRPLQVKTPSMSMQSYNTISCVGNSDVWVGGSQSIQHWNKFIAIYRDDWDYELLNELVNQITDMWFLNTTFGIAVGTNGKIFYRSPQRIPIWEAQSSPTTHNLSAISGTFSSINPAYNVWIVGESGIILKWDTPSDRFELVTTCSTNNNLNDVYVVDENTIWICGNNGTLYHTIDRGVSWQSAVFATPINDDFYSISCSADGEKITVIGEDCSVVRSIDAGVTWNNETVQASGVKLRSVIMPFNGSTGYLVGDDGTILLRNNQSPGYTLADEKVSNGTIIKEAILESRRGRANTVDLIVWNTKDQVLLESLVNNIKPAHIKIDYMTETKLLQDFYAGNDYIVDINGSRVLTDLSTDGTYINGRAYGTKMIRIVSGIDEIEDAISSSSSSSCSSSSSRSSSSSCSSSRSSSSSQSCSSSSSSRSSGSSSSCSSSSRSCSSSTSCSSSSSSRSNSFSLSSSSYSCSSSSTSLRLIELYVVDEGNDRVQTFSADGVFRTEFGLQGSSDGQFNIPRCIVRDASYNVYVVDSGNNRIQKFDSSGTFVTKWGDFGSADGEFDDPVGISVYGNYVYVADTANNRVQKFDTNGVWQSTWNLGFGPVSIFASSDGYVYIPEPANLSIHRYNTLGVLQGIALVGVRISAIAKDSFGNFYYIDDANKQVVKYNASQSFIHYIGQDVYTNPYDISVTDNRIYISEHTNNVVYIYDLDGYYLGSFGSAGTGTGEFDGPFGVGSIYSDG